MSGSYPTVLVAGFPKCGTTFLYHLLKQHPEIFIPKIKELNYFNKDHFFLGDPEVLNPRYFKPKSWYRSFFKTNKKVRIDFSILTALDPAAARRARGLLGDIPIIFIVRNEEKYKRSLKTFLHKEGSDLSDKLLNQYAQFEEHMLPFRELFSRIYVLRMEQLIEQPEHEMHALCSFLGIAPYSFSTAVPHHDTETYNMSRLQFLRRKFYVSLCYLFFRFSSITVRAKIKARGES